jgi:SulP family sulfate permease
MQKFLPFLGWLPHYKKSDFPKDVVAGLTVGIILVPQGMAYAMIAGLPPVYGLYTALVPVLIYAFLGTSRQVGMGPVAMDSLLVAAGLGALSVTGVENYIAMALVLGLSVGVIQLLFGLFRMGFLVNFLSKPVISGFTSGAAIIIIFSQLGHLLGTNIEKSNYFHQLVINSLTMMGLINPYDLAIGLTGILLIVALKIWDDRIPAILLVVILGSLGVYFLDLQDLGVKIVGTVPSGLPSFILPEISVQNIGDIWPIALTLALVGYLETISIGKAIEEKKGADHINANQELVALGTANILGSFFQSYISTASFSRSAINNEAGARTNLAGVISVLLVILTLLFLTPYFYYLPNAALASIIMVSVFGLIDIPYPKSLWMYRKDEFVLLMVTFLATLFIGIKEGILIGVLFSLLLMVYRTSNPHIAVLGNIKNSNYYKNVKRFGDDVVLREDLLIVRFDSQIYFGNSDFFKKELMKHVRSKGAHLKAVILNAEPINYIDSTGAVALRRVIEEIHGLGVQFYLTGAIGPTRDIIYSSGLIDVLKKECLFAEINEAVAYFENPDAISEVQHHVAHQNQAGVTKVTEQKKN